MMQDYKFAEGVEIPQDGTVTLDGSIISVGTTDGERNDITTAKIDPELITLT